MRLLFGILLVALFAFQGNAQVPGFKTAISQGGLNHLKDVGIEVLKKAIQQLEIPDITGVVESPIGNIGYGLEEIVLSGFGIGGSAAVLLPGQGLQLQLSNVQSVVNLKWRYKQEGWPYISDHGTADIKVLSVSSDVKLQVTEQNGRPYVGVISNVLSIGKLEIKLHGGASWLYNLFIKAFSDKIKDAVEKALREAITDNINNGLNLALATLPVSAPISDKVNINFAITGNPAFTSAHFTLPANGEFQQTAAPSACPAEICPRTATPDSITGQMMQMIITDFFANTAGYVFFKLNKLEAHVRDEHIPDWSPVRLNTTSFAVIIPELYKKYPNQKMMIRVYSTESPQARFAPNGATIKAIGHLEVDVLDANNKVIPVFVLSGFINTQGTAYLRQLNLAGNLTFANGNFTLKSSEIGYFDATPLNSLLNLLFAHGIIPAANKYLEEGFPLPTVKGVTFNNPSLNWGDRFLYVSTDITYTPQMQMHMMDVVPPEMEIQNIPVN